MHSHATSASTVWEENSSLRAAVALSACVVGRISNWLKTFWWIFGGCAVLVGAIWLINDYCNGKADELKSELQQEVSDLKSQFDAETSSLKADISELKGQLSQAKDVIQSQRDLIISLEKQLQEVGTTTHRRPQCSRHGERRQRGGLDQHATTSPPRMKEESSL